MKNYFFSEASSNLDFHSDPTVNEWNNRTPLNMPQCKNCAAIGICGGGCAYGAQLRNGSIWSVDDRFCNHSLSILEWVIWDIYKQSMVSAQRIRLDRASEASHDLNRLLDEPGHERAESERHRN